MRDLTPDFDAESTWDAERALAYIEQIEEALDGLREAARGADSHLVAVKLSTLETTLSLLRTYLIEAEVVA